MKLCFILFLFTIKTQTGYMSPYYLSKAYITNNIYIFIYVYIYYPSKFSMDNALTSKPTCARLHDLGNSQSGDLFVLKVMIYLLSLHEIMFYFIFVHNYILILDKAFNIDHFVCLISQTSYVTMTKIGSHHVEHVQSSNQIMFNTHTSRVQ
jgi:uncharacterized membrane protein YhaH (DUF805 family)